MDDGARAIVLAGLGLGIALAGAPGPVQAVLIAESVRGGVTRGFRAMAGASLTFGGLLAILALGVSVAAPSGLFLRVMQVVGGAYLVWLGVEGFRSARPADPAEPPRRTAPPAARGVLAIVLNPGAWVFLAAVASPLLSSAAEAGGRGTALLTAGALLLGAALGDGTIVLVGGLGIRRAGAGFGQGVRRALAILLIGLGVWSVLEGVIT